MTLVLNKSGRIHITVLHTQWPIVLPHTGIISLIKRKRKINRCKWIDIEKRDTMYKERPLNSYLRFQIFKDQTEWELEVAITTINIWMVFFFLVVSFELLCFCYWCFLSFFHFYKHACICMENLTCTSELSSTCLESTFLNRKETSTNLCIPQTQQKNTKLYLYTL